jgi:putative transposase
MYEGKNVQKRHHPYHLYLDNTVYFITARTYQNKRYFNKSRKKEILVKEIRNHFLRFAYHLYAWVVLDNHYHILFETKNGNDLPRVMQYIHGGCSHTINAMEQSRGRKIFQNYWDTGIRNRRAFYIHFNYIHHNPVKHNYVRHIRDYQFSSYQYWSQREGEGWVLSCFEAYPIVDFTLRQDNF